MKLILLSIFCLLVIAYGQVTTMEQARNALYDQIDNERARFCRGKIIRDADLEARAKDTANGACASGSLSVSNGFGYNWASSPNALTADELRIKQEDIFNSAKNGWFCSIDSGPDNYRWAINPGARIGCAFSDPCFRGGSHWSFYVCYYSVFPAFGSLNQCPTCTGSTPSKEVATVAQTVATVAQTVATVAATVPQTQAQTVATVAQTVATVAATTTAPAPSSPPATTPTSESEIWLRLHNQARTCAGVPNYQWDETLATNMRDWVNYLVTPGKGNCQAIHADANSPSPHQRNYLEQGENLWMKQESKYETPENLIGIGVGFWIKENVGWNCPLNTCNPPSEAQEIAFTNSSGNVITANYQLFMCFHYTQVVWRNSTKLGCAFAECPINGNIRTWIGGCRYGPGGNLNMNVGQRPLAPDTNCPNCNANQVSLRSAAVTPAVPVSSSQAASPVVRQQTETKSEKPFFANDSQIVVFVFAIVIAVALVVVLVLLAAMIAKNRNKGQTDYHLLENK